MESDFEAGFLNCIIPLKFDAGAITKQSEVVILELKFSWRKKILIDEMALEACNDRHTREYLTKKWFQKSSESHKN